MASLRIESPADVAARTAPPIPSPILVPVEQRVLSSNVVTRGTARFGLPQPVSIVPSNVKAKTGLITTMPLRNTQLQEGGVALTASGRPVFVLQGRVPAYRDLVPGSSGDDVRQLKQGLKRLGFDPGPIDGPYDERTSAAVARWYTAKGFEPFGPTREQRASVLALEREWADANKLQLTAAAANAAAALAVQSARALAEQNNRAAAAALEAKRAEWRKMAQPAANGTPLAVQSARALAEHNNRAAAADLANAIADRALIVLDPRQPATARAAADAKVELSKAAVQRIKVDGELAVQAAERDADLAVGQLDAAQAAAQSARLEGEKGVQAAELDISLAADQRDLAEAALKSARLEGEKIVQAALDAQKLAELDVRLTAERANRLAVDLNLAKRALGVQVPADEIAFIPSLPVRVHEITVPVGQEAKGSVMSVTDNQLVVDSALPLDAAPLVKVGMRVGIAEQALGIQATGSVSTLADAPGTHGVDGYHVYLEVRVDPTPTPLEGVSLRLTIPIESTKGVVTVVPLSAVSLTADGTSRVQVQKNGTLESVVVKPGLSADGLVEVNPANGAIAPGELVVVGYKTPDNGEPKDAAQAGRETKDGKETAKESK
jgi:peptidoglycan hydrolase-like protein with peptidoglycan-binding domain